MALLLGTYNRDKADWFDITEPGQPVDNLGRWKLAHPETHISGRTYNFELTDPTVYVPANDADNQVAGHDAGEVGDCEQTGGYDFLCKGNYVHPELVVFDIDGTPIPDGKLYYAGNPQNFTTPELSPDPDIVRNWAEVISSGDLEELLELEVGESYTLNVGDGYTPDLANVYADIVPTGGCDSEAENVELSRDDGHEDCTGGAICWSGSWQADPESNFPLLLIGLNGVFTLKLYCGLDVFTSTNPINVTFDPLNLDFTFTGVNSCCLGGTPANININISQDPPPIPPITCGSCVIPQTLLVTYQNNSNCACMDTSHQIIYRGLVSGQHRWNACPQFGDVVNVGVTLPLAEMPGSCNCGSLGTPGFINTQLSLSCGFGCPGGFSPQMWCHEDDNCIGTRSEVGIGRSGSLVSADPFQYEVTYTDFSGFGPCNFFGVNSWKQIFTAAP